MTGIRKRCILVFAILTVAAGMNSSVSGNTHEGSTCWPLTDCDDSMMAVMNINGTLRCVSLWCMGGANDFRYCQQFQSALSPCVTSGTANVDCGVNCSYYDCGLPVGNVCPSGQCDTSVPPTPINGTLTILKTCT